MMKRKTGRVLAVIVFVFTVQSRSAITPEEVPVVTVDGHKDGLVVMMNGEILCELRDYRYLRFRSNVNNDHWIGQRRMPADIGWDYNDLKGYEPVSFTSKVDPGRFEIHLIGRKDAVDGDQNTVITGVWDSETGNFDYTLYSHISADLEKWYQKSVWAVNSYKKWPDARVMLQPMNYHVERISAADLAYAENRSRELYECFVYSNDGKNWTRFPKVRCFYGMYKANWKHRFSTPVDSCWGFADSKEGGWMMRPKQASGKPNVDICWFWLDIHLLLEEALPPRGSSERFEAVSEWEFDKLTPEQSREIIAKAEEFPWRDMPEYRRPVYTQNSNFRDQITGTQSEWVWRSSGANCLWDTAVGYDDHSSIMIVKTNDQPDISAWYAQFQWHGYLMDTPFDWEPIDLNATYCISAMVKTKNVTGEVRLAVVNASGSPVLYNNDRYDMKNAQFKKSKGLSGDNDWTELSVTFTPGNRAWENISLEIEGQGQVWFDNVSIIRIDNP